MFQHMRPGPYDRHISNQHIEKLGNFVKACFSQEPAHRSDPRIVLGGLLHIGLAVDVHSAELVTPETLVIPARAELFKENRSLGIELDANGDNGHQPGEDQYDDNQRESKIKY